MITQIQKSIYFKVLLITFPIIILASCDTNKQSQEMLFKSANGKTAIFIKGNKPSFGDPWQATIKIKTPKDEQEVVTEIYADELNNETVQLNWDGNEKCKVAFLQQDNSKRIMVIEADSNHINLHEE